jgi:hypothetical protein
MTATMHGIPVHLSTLLPDGEMALSVDYGLYGDDHAIVWIGCAPLDEHEQAKRDARRTVRRGLADVLAWLGEPVENEPGGVEIWEALLREGKR